MGSQSLSPQQTQARPSSSSMAASPNPPGNGSLVAAASSALQGGAGGGLGGSRFNSLARQSSIYSLTLDEFQNAMTEPGKNFGSMNMDEFLKNIWTAEESQAMAAAMGSSSIAAADTSQAAGNVDGMSMLLRQPSLQLLQGAMSLPRTLSRKTVDQVWKDIHRDSSSGGSDSGGGLPLGPTSTSVQERQTTFGEMTLEDFLMKAGVVREDAADIGTSQQQQAFSSFMGSSALHPHGERSDRINVQSGDPGDRISGATAASGRGDIVPTLSLSPANVMPSQASIEAMQMDAYNKNQAATAASQQQQQVDWLRSMAQQQQQQHFLQQQVAEAAAYANATNKRMGNGSAGPMLGMAGPLGMAGQMGPGAAAVMGAGLPGGMHGGGLAMGLGGLRGGHTDVNMGLAPGSPPTPDSDGMLSPMHYGLDGPFRGRKRGPDGPVEKVVERRQRRMIKNRESAARSRARKQAYTVELEAEVNQLKEENSRLRKQQDDSAEWRKKQLMEMMKLASKSMASKANVLRRTRTAMW